MMLICVIVLAISIPAWGAHTPAHAIEEIEAIAAQAMLDMDAVVTDFEQDIAGMSTATEVAAAEDAALDEIDGIWVAARDAIDELALMYPGPLGKAAGEAKKAIQDERVATRAAVGDLADAWVPPATTTTSTTTSTTTTTTTAPTTTTTTNGNSGNGGGGSGNGNGNGPPVTTPGDQGQGTSGSTDTSQTGSSGSGSNATSTEDPITSVSDEITTGSESVLILATETPQETAFFTPKSMSLVSEASGSTATQRMAAALDTVLPPAVVDLVLSPLLIVEILIGTILDGGARVIGPLALLGLCALVMFAYDRRSRRSVAATGAH